MAEGADARLPQMPLNMPPVFVKNTFLDLDDAPRMPELQRWKSAPNPEPIHDDSDDESEVTAGEAEGDPGPPPLPDLYRTKTCDGYDPADEWTWLGGGDPGLGGLGADLNLGGCLGPGGGLLGGGEFAPLPGMGQIPSSMGPPQAPQAQPMGPGAVGAMPPQVFGMVMVQADGMPGAPMFAQPVPGGVPPPFPMPGLPPGYVAYPVGRFTRWPEILPVGAPMPSPDGQLPAAMPPPKEAGSTQPASAEDPAAAASASSAAPAPAEPVPGDAQGGDLSPSNLAPAPPRAPVLQRTFSVPSSLDRIRWTVDARKLKSTDREAVSPMFELSFSRIVNFKILIHPKAVNSSRGGASFKKAKGKGSVELRCLDEVSPAMNPVVTFRISVGSGTDPSRQEPPRGPVKHDFTKKAICGLPPGQEEWDFLKAVDEATQTFVVCLEVLAGTAVA